MRTNGKSFITAALFRLLREPPFRLMSKALVGILPFSVRTRAFWDAASRPQYLFGVLTAADMAARCGVSEISVIEFGVGSGDGLLLLQEYSQRVSNETGIAIRVFGFDTGRGLPTSCGDYRDHPDLWQPGQYNMDVDLLRSRLGSSTQLILGDISETLPTFIGNADYSPVGFISIDLDLYSSTKEALQLFTAVNRRILREVVIYLDDIGFINTHRYAGELLAMRELNEQSDRVKIDRWVGVEVYRPFQEAFWLKQMFVAHDIEAISGLVND